VTETEAEAETEAETEAEAETETETEAEAEAVPRGRAEFPASRRRGTFVVGVRTTHTRGREIRVACPTSKRSATAVDEGAERGSTG
jgi:hypothetical protein